MKVVVGSDHRGFEAKQQIKAIITQLGHESIDFGTNDSQPVDYPDTAYAAAMSVSNNQADRGMLICATGMRRRRRFGMVSTPPGSGVWLEALTTGSSHLLGRRRAPGCQPGNQLIERP